MVTSGIRYMKQLSQDLQKGYEKALQDQEEQDQRFAELAGLIQSGASAGASHEAIWHDLQEVIALRTKTPAAERRGQVDEGYMVDVSKVMLFDNALIAAATEVVTDKGVSRQLTARTLALLPPAE
jgi:hypothetical protein